jgi:hypothetical protein
MRPCVQSSVLKKNFKKAECKVRWCILTIPVFWRLRQEENCKFKASLYYIARPSFKTTKTNKKTKQEKDLLQKVCYRCWNL